MAEPKGRSRSSSGSGSGAVVLALEGVGLFFACGHGYVKAVDGNPPPGAAPVETELVCPRCRGAECPRCGGCFSGRWCDFCTVCSGFWNFAAWVDYAVASGAGRIRFRQGVILVPHDVGFVVGGRMMAAATAAAAAAAAAAADVRSSWPDLLTLGDGDVELHRREVGPDGDLVIDASATLRVKDQVDHRGRPDTSRIGEKMTWTVCSMDCDVKLDSDEYWLPPEPTLDFSDFLDVEDEEHV